jgi:hypothetical protein
MRLMMLIKLVKLFVLWSEFDPLCYNGGVFYLIPLFKNTYSSYSHLQITIDVVTVNLLFLQLVYLIKGDYHFRELVYHFGENKFSLLGIFIYLFRDFFHVKFEVGYIISGRNKL